MNKIYKVMYSKVKQCAVVVSEIAKSHGHNGESSSVRKHAALMAAVLIALGSFSFTTAFVPMTAEAANKTDGSHFVGVERTDGVFDDSDYANHNGKGAHGDDSITVGLKAIGGDGTITIGDRSADKSLGSVYVGRGPGMPTGKVLPDKTDDGYWATSVGYQSDATGYGSIAIGSNATANNSYDKDSTGHGIILKTTSGDGKTVVLNGKPDIQRASVAIGYGANADNGNIAIGSYSDASTDLRATTGDAAKAYLTEKTADSYVSVGKTGALRRISNVADGAADSDAATISQLKKAVEATDASKKANIDASNIGKNLKYKADGKTAADSSDITTNEDAWGTAIGTGEVADKNGQLVTGGTVFSALQQQTDNLKPNAGWGINVADETDENGNVTKKNVISLKRNLGKNYGSRYGTGKVNFEADGENSLILGGGALNDSWEDRDKEVTYGAHGKDSILVGGLNNDIAKDSEKVATSIGTKASIGTRAVIIGGTSNTVSYDPVTEKDSDTGKEKVKVDSNGNVIVQTQKTGTDAIIVGGLQNTAKGDGSVLIGGESNEATGLYSTVIGGTRNKTDGWLSSIFGGTRNTITGDPTAAGIFGGTGNTINSNGIAANVFGGENNTADNTLAVVVGGEANTSSGPASIILGGNHNTANQLLATVVGGQLNTATGETSMISGGIGNVTSGAYSYDAGGLYNRVTGMTASSLGGLNSSVNGMFSTGVAGGSTGENAILSLAAGYQSVVTDSGVEKTYVTGDDAEKVLEDQYSGKELPGYYTRDQSVDYGPGEPGRLIHYDKFATALGYQATADEYGTIAFGHDADDESGYTYEWEQLPAGKYAVDGTTNDYSKAPKSVKKKAPYTSAYYNRLVKIADGKDAHDAVTVEQLNKVQNDLDTSKTHFYNVNSKDTEAGNYNNDGAKGAGSMAAGFNTHADGIASTVAGSYSGVINSGTAQGLDLRGAAALSYGTVNVNQNTDPTKAYSGVANSIVGQANMTTNSNAAIIYGAGNTVTDSYRPIDKEKAKAILGSTSDPKALSKAMQDAVKDSGGQVMVMGGGNVVDNAYMSQVTGVGNTVKGNQVYAKNAKTGKWEWTTDTNKDTAIQGYDKDKSSQYNYVDGFSNEVINGKHDYVIGANNKLSGDSYDDDTAQPIKRSNRSNIVIGDNHTLTREQNTVIIGSSDTENTQTKARDAVIIGHNANATNDTGADNAVAIGLSATATGGNAVTIGVNTSAGATSITIGSESSAISGSNIAIGRYAKVYGDKVTNAVALGKLAEAHVADGVAIGSESQATVAGNSVEGYDPGTGEASTDETATWKATKAAVSIGKADGTVTRQINGLAAGTKDTDAVNVAQLKSLQSGLTEDLTGKGLKFAANSGAKYTAELGSTVTIQGTGKKAGHEYTAENLTTEVDGSGNITILMDKNISADKIAVNGKDGKDAVSIAGKDGVGHIGLTGPAGTNGMNGADGKPGTSINITVKNGYDDTAKGINGTNGVDGKDGITRIVYTDKTGEHQVATLEDGLKFKGDAGTEIAKKLNNTLEIVGGVTDSTKLTDGNIGVVSENGKLNVRLAKDLTGLNSTTYTTKTGEGESETTSTTVVNGNGLTIKDGPSITNNGIDGGKKTITNVGSGIKAGTDGKYTVTDANNSNAANIGDVNNMVNQAVGKLTEDTKNDLAGKANVDATNVGANISGSDEQKKTNEKAWASAIGTGNINAPEGMLITDAAVHNEVRPKENGNYVKKDKTTGENLSALDSKIGKLDETKKYNYIDSGKDVSISDNLTKLDTQVKNNADAISKEKQDRENAITNITNNIGNLSDSAVKYDAGTNKGKVTLAGADGTTITNLKAGEVAETSKEAVNGSQLYAEQKARTDADNKLTSDLVTETQARTEADTAINNKIGSLDKDGSYRYITKENSVSQNLSALDSGLKATSDLINTNDKRDTIRIGASSTATKIDVKGKDGKGRVITGVVTDDGDPTSAANVGYVNGVTAANTQQIYRDMNNAYGRLNNNINKAAAGSNALAALHPLDYDPDDKADFAVGYGHYRNANAAALGAFYHPNENTMVNVGVSLGNGDPGFNAGVSFKIGSGSAGHQAMSKTEMAKVINSQSKEIDALKKDNADKDKRIDALEQKMAEILAKLDKNGQ